VRIGAARVEAAGFQIKSGAVLVPVPADATTGTIAVLTPVGIATSDKNFTVTTTTP